MSAPTSTTSGARQRRRVSARRSPAPRWRSWMAASRTTPSSSLRSNTSLDLKVEALPGVGSESAKLLERLGIRTIGDLLWHLPTRYVDFSQFRPLRALVAEQEQSAIAILGEISQRRTARGQLLTEAELLEQDGAPSQVRASWFGRAFIKETHRTGERVRISGRVRWVGRSLQFSQPALEPAA